MMDEAANYEVSTVNNEVVEEPDSIEKYIPQGYPRFLLQGTSLGNSRQIQQDGLGGGTLSTYIFDCLNDRFYRKTDGRLIVAAYNPDTFIMYGLDSTLPAYQYCRIKEGTGPEREISFTSLDTDGMSQGFGGSVTGKTSCYVSPQEMGSLEIVSQQRELLNLYGELIGGQLLGKFDEKEFAKVAAMLRKYNLPDSAAGVAGGGTNYDMLSEARLTHSEDIHYRIAIRQKEMARVLGLDYTDFVNWETLERAINSVYPDEEDFFDRLTSQFLSLGELQWDWKNVKESDDVVVRAILQQMYQQQIVNQIKIIVVDGKTPSLKRLALNGESVAGLNRLKTEKGL